MTAVLSHDIEQAQAQQPIFGCLSSRSLCIWPSLWPSLCIWPSLCPYVIHAYACTQLLAEERSAYNAAAKAKAATIACTSVDLDMRIKIVDGDAVIADTEAQVGMNVGMHVGMCGGMCRGRHVGMCRDMPVCMSACVSRCDCRYWCRVATSSRHAPSLRILCARERRPRWHRSNICVLVVELRILACLHVRRLRERTEMRRD